LKRREFLKAAGAGAGASLVMRGAGCRKSAGRPPNIVFILVDDLGWRDVGFMGSRFYETPNIDRLAALGMVFTRAYAAAAVCSPTRASILTGRAPARLGITDWIRAKRDGGVIGPERRNPEGYDDDPAFRLMTPRNALFMELGEVTTAEVLKKAGYATGHVGKWHLGPDEFSPRAQGFDENVGGADIGHTNSYFDPYLNEGSPIPDLAPRREGEYMTDREADEACAFVRRHRDGPFYLNLCHYAVHVPLQAKDGDVALFNGKPAVDGQKDPVYAAMIKSVDDAVGRLVATLDELGLTEKTCVFFFSDNGGLHTVTDNAPLRMGKGFPYEGGIREALAVSWPGTVPESARCGVPVSSIDFFPTILRLAGCAVPADRAIDGLDLSGILTGRATELEGRDLFWHFPHYWWGDRVRPWSAVLSGPWKLIRFYEDGRRELYDLENDASEARDLASSRPDLVEGLDRKLDAWLGETGAKLPRPNPRCAL
jgi:arylsulfatase A-like enzyme